LKKEDIALKKEIKDLKPAAMRQKLLKTARQFLGDKYSWGGRSGFETDCSGLVNLSYRVFGMDLPRNAHDQFTFAKAVKKENLKPADLIFSSLPGNKKEIDHVMIYSGKESLIEATRETNSIREISFKEKFGKNLSDIKNSQAIDGSKIYFRRIIKK
ncbi:MAG: C40 family peptidase, partial [Elusimicrobiales bacterium]|nr:C40 family peptidase [Elusimicrobiales bacterium]